jgi:hypothetical protein
MQASPFSSPNQPRLIKLISKDSSMLFSIYFRSKEIKGRFCNIIYEVFLFNDNVIINEALFEEKKGKKEEVI